tara:strand:- start:1546 stop:1839 length:294 start_codon:yes stop_codon:yes gene_type:complete
MSKVEYTRETLPPLTKAQQDDLKRLAAMPDNGGDTDDMPELTAAQLAGMQKGTFYRPVKKQITARVDADVLTWLKSQGKGYQSRMNAILRDAMLNTK